MNTKHIIRIFFIFALTSSLIFAGSKPEEDAQKAAEQWLSLVDAGNYAGSWKTAAALFKTAVTEEQWERQLIAARKPLGDLVSRKLYGAKYTSNLPGAPDGEYVVLRFDTTFTNKKSAVETVTPMREKDASWKVSGYYSSLQK